MCDKVVILISTYNGKDFLESQLDSIYKQSYTENYIVARDDGSRDKTLDILKSFDVELLESKKNLGAKGSFSELLSYELKKDSSKYFMFCDQDDIWIEDKIKKSIKKIKELEEKFPNLPILVHSDLRVVDSMLCVISKSFWKHENINPDINTFNRLLMQNTITGCTVVINKKLAQMALPIPKSAIMHDWWLGLVASKFGKIDFIETPLVLYRQHDNNVIGAKGFKKIDIFKKFYKIFYKNELYLKHLDGNILQAKAFLNKYKDLLDDRTISMLEDFSDMNNKSFFQKRVILLKYKLFKQGFLRNLGLLLKI